VSAIVLDGAGDLGEYGMVDMRTASKFSRASGPPVAPSSAGSHVDNTSAAEVEATEDSGARGPFFCGQRSFAFSGTLARPITNAKRLGAEKAEVPARSRVPEVRRGPAAYEAAALLPELTRRENSGTIAELGGSVKSRKPRARVTPEIARGIREWRARGEGLRDTAEHFGTSISITSEVARGKYHAEAGGPLTRSYRQLTGTLAERIRSLCVIPANDGACWGWSGEAYRDGAPRIHFGDTSLAAYRAALEIKLGRKLERKEIVVWSCGARFCMNTDHMGAHVRARKDRHDYFRAYNSAWLAKRRKEWFAGRCCVWCGSTTRLEMDHIDPSQKEAHAVWSWTASRRARELAKCRVLCHTCHVKRHADERRKPLVHGTGNAYRQKRCRCDACRAWNRDRVQRERIPRTLLPVPANARGAA